MIISREEIEEILKSLGYSATGNTNGKYAEYKKNKKESKEIWLGNAFVENTNFQHSFPYIPECEKDELIEFING